ncbi:MAG: hypothetical protein QM811_15320 [Pirellulales bacterium]
MSTIAEVESAIERLPTAQVDELAVWLEAHCAERSRRAAAQASGAWLNRARGAARSGASTDEIMTLTRGEE